MGFHRGKQYRNNGGNAIMMTNSAETVRTAPCEGCFCVRILKKMQAGSAAAAQPRTAHSESSPPNPDGGQTDYGTPFDKRTSTVLSAGSTRSPQAGRAGRTTSKRVKQAFSSCGINPQGGPECGRRSPNADLHLQPIRPLAPPHPRGRAGFNAPGPCPSISAPILVTPTL